MAEDICNIAEGFSSTAESISNVPERTGNMARNFYYPAAETVNSIYRGSSMVAYTFLLKHSIFKANDTGFCSRQIYLFIKGSNKLFNFFNLNRMGEIL
ncbi:MAG: hypothetical protein WCS69_07000 [Ignavibacteriaceae bacterium]